MCPAIYFISSFLTHHKATLRESLLKVSTILYPWLLIPFKLHFHVAYSTFRQHFYTRGLF